MVVSLAASVRNTMLDAIITALSAGPAAPYLEVRSGTRPANVATAATGTVLAVFTLNDPAFGAAAAGTAALVTTPALSSTALASGTATWVRVYDSTGVVILDGTCGTSAAEFILNTTNILAGAVIALASGSLSMA